MRAAQLVSPPPLAPPRRPPPQSPTTQRCLGRPTTSRPGTPRAPRSPKRSALRAAKSLSASMIPPMTPEEHLTLSPWEKCARFREFRSPPGACDVDLL